MPGDFFDACPICSHTQLTIKKANAMQVAYQHQHIIMYYT